MGTDSLRRAPASFAKAVSLTLRKASLDTKLIIGVVFVALLGLGAMFVALSRVIEPNFEMLEHQEVARHVDRTNATLDEFSMRVETAVRDYGAWNDSFDYLRNPTQEFEGDTFSLLALTNLDVSGMAYVRFGGEIVFSRWVDLDKQIEVQTMGRAFDALLRSPAVLAGAKSRPSLRFYSWVGDKLVAISTAQVIRTDGSGTPTGFVVMARVIDSTQLSELLSLKASLARNARTDLTGARQDDPFVQHISVPVHGIDGKPVAHAQFGIKRTLSEMGRRTLFIALAAATIVLFMALLVLSRLIRHQAINPLKRVEQHMQTITLTGDPAPLAETRRQDEIGSLILSLNTMLSQLKNLREQLEIQSFRLGRTESAVGLMHNVRNGLNPVNIILGQALQTQPPVAQADVERAFEELGQGSGDQARRQRLLDFVRATMLGQYRSGTHMEHELESARTHLNRVIELIGDQQAAAHERVETQACDPRAVIDQNAALARYSSIGNIRFSVDENAPPVEANRVLLSQVIGNLFGNAVESIQSAQRKQGLVEVTFEEAETQHGRCARIKVRDNGEGFDPASQKKLFEKGFSTRKHKSGGLGLHWCAHAVKMMDGELQLTSDGKGLGATAIITLPKAQRASAQMVPSISADRAEQDPVPDMPAEDHRREIQNLR
ncbi:MAG TPA: CHASE4 domain-containing protein [Chakrabartia sp.]|nr:CHASE4 domain-containing protein [Chakrabartia sp.]